MQNQRNNLSRSYNNLFILYISKGRSIIHSIGGITMNYMTLKEASEKLGISARMINYYCTAKRISGAVKMGTVWLIPKNAVKPIDNRTKEGRKQKP